MSADHKAVSNGDGRQTTTGAECNNPPTIKLKEFKPPTVKWGDVNKQFDVLLITVNDKEFDAAARILSSPQRTDAGKRLGPFYFGKIGENIVALVRSAPGAIGTAAAQSTCQDAIEELSPKVIVLLGVCFGMRKDKQSLGDLLVAIQTAFYSQGRINEDNSMFSRSSQPQCEARLQRAFQDGKVAWTAPGDGEINPKVHFGLVLSGPQLIDNEKRKEELRKIFPEALGGEMEAEGVYSLCDRHKIPWILCKSICDWADGSKNKNWQPYAAAVSASFVEHVLEQTYLPGTREENGEQRDGGSTSASSAQKPNSDLTLDIPDGPSSVNSELLDEEIGGIAKRIGRNWKGVALRTKKFQPHEIDNIFYSRVNQDESSKAEEMLLHYKEMGGTRENLVRVLNRLKLCNVAKKVASGYFVDNE